MKLPQKRHFDLQASAPEAAVPCSHSRSALEQIIADTAVQLPLVQILQEPGFVLQVMCLNRQAPGLQIACEIRGCLVQIVCLRTLKALQVYSSSRRSSKLSTKAATLQQPLGSETVQQQQVGRTARVDVSRVV